MGKSSVVVAFFPLSWLFGLEVDTSLGIETISVDSVELGIKMKIGN